VRSGLLAALVLASVTLLGAGCGTGGLTEPGSPSAGQQLFVENCGACHTLAHAGTQGKVGPNLDAAFAVMKEEDYPPSTVLEIVAKQIKYPNTHPATGEPGMPANLVTGSGVNDVATYVACAAGIPAAQAAKDCGAPAGSGGGGGGGGGSSDPKALFNSEGCSGCHTLSAAGATGTIGPNLDQSSIDEAGAITQITNGGAVMPAFKDKLSEEQIKALAHFVVTSRGQ
jgi:mono/diheme cytochrome c family protein